MVLFRREFHYHVYHFIGSDAEWKEFIIKSSLSFKESYLCDRKADRRAYPKTIRILNSVHTAKRLQFTRLSKAAIYLGDIDWQKWFTNTQAGDYIVIRTNLLEILELLHYGLIELTSKRTLRYLKLYK